jgi:hypothetical protein
MRARRAAAIVIALVATPACLTSSDIASSFSAGAGAEDGAGARDGTGAGEETGGSDGTGTSSPAPCGDGICAPAEDCASCPEDCECLDPVCGDGACDTSEDCMTCDADCGACATCGDGDCGAGEDCELCFQDCGVCACAPDAFEPNGSSTLATTVSLGVDYCDLSVCAADFDWLEFDVNGTTTATITFLQAQGDLDLEIYSATTIDYVTGSYSADDDESVTLMGLPPGPYWARIYGDQGAENPAYCFRAD